MQSKLNCDWWDGTRQDRAASIYGSLGKERRNKRRRSLLRWFYSTPSGTIVSPFTAPLAPLGIRVSERSNRPSSLALGVNTKHCKEGQTIPRHLCLRAMMNCHISSSKPLSSRPPQLPCNIQFTLLLSDPGWDAKVPMFNPWMPCNADKPIPRDDAMGNEFP